MTLGATGGDQPPEEVEVPSMSSSKVMPDQQPDLHKSQSRIHGPELAKEL